MPKVVLGICGSVAAYRAADLARELMREGFTVRTCLTDSAQQFVTPALFEALTGQPCLQGAFEEPEPGKMAHIEWARSADLIVIAPATANTLVNLAQGSAVDMLTTIAVASEAPLVVAPAMNPTMLAAETTKDALKRLEARGATIVQPETGMVACGENGQGKLASISAIVQACLDSQQSAQMLAGKTVLITSGPTAEPIDIARFISNRSSGRMGAALAQAVHLCGGTAIVVSGPVSITYPASARVIGVRTAEEMLAASLSELPHADIIFAAAAVADYRPATVADGKLRRDGNPIALNLVPNPDIIAELTAHKRSGAIAVAFAAEPSADPRVAQEKLVRKKVDYVAMNDVSRSDIGFGSGQNELILVSAKGEPVSSGIRTKLGCAKWLIERVTAR